MSSLLPWQLVGSGDTWEPPRGSEIRLWRIRNDPRLDSSNGLAALWQMLDADERAKADRYRVPQARRASILARGMTRLVVGKYLGLAPTSLRFACNAYGKPALADDVSARRLPFNVSHSGDWVVLAVSAAGEIGVDIEHQRPLENALQLAERFFSESERLALAQLSAAERLTAFYRCWTRKEAYIKAVGTGIFTGLDQFDVTLLPEEPPCVVRFHSDEYVPDNWSLQDFWLEDGYSAAVMVRQSDPRLHFHDLILTESAINH